LIELTRHWEPALIRKLRRRVETESLLFVRKTEMILGRHGPAAPNRRWNNFKAGIDVERALITGANGTRMWKTKTQSAKDG
jgi:hypothetical protein